MGRRAGCVDLFGEVPVTWPEVWAWLEAVPGIARDSWRAPYYLSYWNVPEKIRAAKRAGSFEAIIAGGDQRKARTFPRAITTT